MHKLVAGMWHEQMCKYAVLDPRGQSEKTVLQGKNYHCGQSKWTIIVESNAGLRTVLKIALSLLIRVHGVEELRAL